MLNTKKLLQEAKSALEEVVAANEFLLEDEDDEPTPGWLIRAQQILEDINNGSPC